MATLKAGTTAGGSAVLTDNTHNSTGDPHNQYTLTTDLTTNYYNKTTVDTLLDLKVDDTELPDLEQDKLDAEAAAAAALVSETNAATSETNADTSASQASTSATNASTSAGNAATSEANAATSETNAAASASAASTSATNASTSETNAAASASAASTSASNASTSETNAATSESNAATSATNAETAYDNFDDRYLGQKASDPSLDNDGDALITGALYFNTTDDKMKVYTGSVWADVAPTATSITLSQVSDVTATAAEVNKLDGVTATAAELNYVDGVTSAIQTQLDDKVTRTGFNSIPGDNLFAGAVNFAESVTYAPYSLTGNVIDADKGMFQYKTISGNTTFALDTPSFFTNKSYVIVLKLINGGSATVTWPAMIEWAGGTAPTLTAAGTDIITLFADESGTDVWYGVASVLDAQ